MDAALEMYNSCLDVMEDAFGKENPKLLSVYLSSVCIDVDGPSWRAKFTVVSLLDSQMLAICT